MVAEFCRLFISFFQYQYRFFTDGCSSAGSLGEADDDGSIIDFNSDSELEQLKPKNVLPPGSKPVPPAHRGKRQAGTAWEALREYVFNYLAAL